jgi:sialic acid synthase SpsE
MLDKVAATGKQINLSIGASTLEEIGKAVARINAVSPSKIVLMYGIQNFPTSIEEINLNFMLTLKERFGLPIGYQDHCDAQFADAFRIPALAAGMGVAVLEKHITHDRSFKGIDHESALNPDEFKDFVNMVRKLECAKGSPEARPFSENELKYREFQKKSITAARDIPGGTALRGSDLLFLRAEELGIPPDNYESLVNRTTKRDINAFQIIREEDLN